MFALHQAGKYVARRLDGLFPSLEVGQMSRGRAPVRDCYDTMKRKSLYRVAYKERLDIHAEECNIDIYLP